MSKDYYMKQCHFIRTVHGRTVNLIAWIPEKFAIKDKIVKLKMGEEYWVDGWVVDAVGNSRTKSTTASERSRDYLHQREASDI